MSIKQEPSDKLYGMPLWDLYACEICGSVLLKNTVALHEKYHATEGKAPEAIPPRIKPCPECGIDITIPIEKDGSMNLEDYDLHMESHGVVE